MKIRRVLVWIFLLLSFKTYAQFTYGNTWVDTTQTYIKLQVAEDGIYRLSATNLINFGNTQGIDYSTVHPDHFHLIFRGQEEYIYIQNTGNPLTLDGTDFIEFYGRKNDGKIEQLMYKHPTLGINDPTQQPNMHNSLFTDTASYFLTVNSNPGLHYTSFFDNNYTSPQNYIRAEAFKQFTNSIFLGSGNPEHQLDDIKYPEYTRAEGYMSNTLNGNINNSTYNAATPQKYSTSTNPVEIETRVAVVETAAITVSVSCNGNSIGSLNYTGMNTFSGNVSIADITSHTNLTFNSASSEYFKIAYIKAKYDRTLDLQNGNYLKFYNNSFSNIYHPFSNVAYTSQVYVYDKVSHSRIEGTESAGNYQVVLPGTAGSEHEMVLFSDQAIKTPVLAPANLVGLGNSNAGAEFVIITHPKFINSANKYANYRSSNSINQLSAKVVTVDQIYDEYAYGSMNPLGIKRFVKDALDHWTVKPKYFLLWGKGTYFIKGASYNLVPSYGYPASDWLYVSNFGDTANYEPQAAIGRVTFLEDFEGEGYLGKIQQYEASSHEEWQKEGILLAGGNTVTQQVSIQSHMNKWKSTFEGFPNGGEKHYFKKTTTSQTGAEYDEEVSYYMDRGISVLTFFAHSSVSVFEVDLNSDPTVYHNTYKNPFIMGFGCNSGNFTTSYYGVAEKYVNHPTVGAVGFLSQTDFGFLGSMGQLGDTLYKKIYVDSIGKTIGNGIVGSYAAMYNELFSYSNQRGTVNTFLITNLLGDPSLKLPILNQPDYVVEPTSLFITPENFSLNDDSLDIKVIVKNLGIATHDSFYVSLKQWLSGNDTIYHPAKKLPYILFRDTLIYRIPSPGINYAGVNFFNVFADSSLKITETREDNNQLTISYFLPANVATILKPYNYSIIDSNTVTLAAGSFDFENESVVHYYFQLDTTPSFNSPFLKNSGVINGNAYYAEWKTPITLQDSGVYFWRVRLADQTPVVYDNASFKYIPNTKGWAQSKPAQFDEDKTFEVDLNEYSGVWDFANIFTDIYVKSGNSYALYINGENGLPLTNGIGLAKFFYVILDGKTLELKTGQGQTGLVNIVLSGNQINMESAISAAKNGDYVLIFTKTGAEMQNWTNSTYDAVESIGSANIRSITTNQPFVVFGRKGAPMGSAIEVFSPDTAGRYSLDTRIFANKALGKVYSMDIGPGTNWQSVFWNWTSMENQFSDYSSLKIASSNYFNSYNTLDSNETSKQITLPPINPTNSKDPNAQHFLHLTNTMIDSINRTAPQLKNWHVVYTPVAEMLFRPDKNYKFSADSIQEGDTLRLSLTIQNIAEIPSDSVLLRFAIQKPDRSVIELGTKRFRPLAAYDTLILNYEFPTYDTSGSYLGINDIIIEINPNYDQPEQYTFNNVYTKSLSVYSDVINPILDVTFDGIHIANGDIVAANPEILIQINDENNFLPMDTTSFEVFLQNLTNATTPIPVYFANSIEVEWELDAAPNNKIKMYYRPNDLKDGEYRLTVQGKDKTGNESGKVSYEIDFEVVNKNTVTRVFNYPNPFSTKTKFVYTLTGQYLPDVFRIDVYTVTGKLVKSIDLLALESVRIGKNVISDYTWDGTDNFGDYLANGVYFYKVTVKNKGEVYEIRNEGSNETFFKKDFGKLYIMR